MPRAGRICLTEGCLGRVPKTNRLGYCDDHKPKNQNPWARSDGSYGERLPASTVAAILVKYPICYDPFGWKCTAKSTDVDHVIPKWKGGTDRLDNLRGACSTCHRRKSALEGVEARAARRQEER